MSGFKFQIGEIVTTKVGVEDAKRRCEAGAASLPNLGMIVERMTQECPGGVQVHYLVAIAGQADRMNEIELCSPSEFDYAGMAALAEAKKAEADARKRLIERKALNELMAEWKAEKK